MRALKCRFDPDPQRGALQGGAWVEESHPEAMFDISWVAELKHLTAFVAKQYPKPLVCNR